jgi:hypothetical protein
VPGDSQDQEKMVLVVGPGGLDPATAGSITIQLDRSLSESLKDIDANELATLTDLGPTDECGQATGSPTAVDHH